MPESAFRVRLLGQPVAILERTDRGTAMVFEAGYREGTHQPVLGQWFLDQDLGRRIRSSSLLPWFANLLPEGWLRAYVAGGLTQMADDLEMLALLGHDLPGAVEVSLASAERPSPVRADTDWEGAPVVPFAPGTIRFSLSGVQPKLSVDRGERITVPVGGRDGRWILKLPDAKHPHLPEVEYAIMRWAKAIGLRVPDIDLVEMGDVVGLPSGIAPAGRAFLCRRFDRTEDGARIHQEDFAQVLGLAPDLKYGGASGDGSYVRLGRILRRIAGPAEAIELVRRIAFDVVCGNGDAHLKNWSLRYVDGRTPTLSPAYDVVSTILYPIYEPTLALPFPGGPEMRSITPLAFREMGKRVGLSPDETETAAVETARSAARELRHLLPDLPLDDGERVKLEEHVSLVRLTS